MNPFNALTESAAYHSARAANDLRESLSYARQRAADNAMAAMVEALQKGLNDARSANTGLCEWDWDARAAAEMVLRYIVSCPQVPR
jgi:hypothetical protein